MKKYIKFIIIALLVIAAVTVTCFLFFYNYNKNKQTEVSLTNVYQSEDRITFNKNFTSTVTTIINSDHTDYRFDLIEDTINNLDNSMQFISSYFVENDFVIISSDLANLAEAVNASVSLANSMMNEISIKAFIRNDDGDIVGNNTFYNRHLGANDLYKCTSKLLVNYANLIKEVQNHLEFNTDVDVRFSVIELYSDVVINTFANLKENATLEEISDSSNINLMNACLNWNGYELVTNTSMFSADNYEFIKYYNLSNKTELAKNLNNIYANINGVVNPTDEQYAVIYFKEVFGI